MTHIVRAMMDAVNHWWDSWHRFVELDIDPVTDEERIPKDSIPFWVSTLVDTVKEQTGETFDYMSGRWSKE